MSKSIVSIVKDDLIEGLPSDCSPTRINRIKMIVAKGTAYLGGLENIVKNGDRVFVKPNLFSLQNPDKATTTDPALILAVVELLRDFGAGEVLVGENPALAPARKIFSNSGLKKGIKKYGGKCLFLDEELFVRCTDPRALILGEVGLPQKFIETDLFISIPKLKTHVMTMLTLAIKNNMGLIDDHDRKNRLHKEDLHYKLAEILYYAKPDLTIEDALWAAEGQGPIYSEAVKMNTLVLSNDVVAADAVTAYLAGFEPEEITATRLAGAMGIGNCKLDNIEIRGSGIDNSRRYLKRAISSPIGFAPGVDVYAGGACVFCLSIIRTALDQLCQENAMSIAEKFAFIVGSNPPIPPSLKKRAFVVGNCAEKYKHLGPFFSGCPPLPDYYTTKIMDQFIKSKKHFG